MNQLKQIITKVKIQLYFMAVLRCLLVAGSAYFAVLFLLQSSSFAIIAFVLSALTMAYFTKLFQDKSKETKKQKCKRKIRKIKTRTKSKVKEKKDTKTK